MYAVNISNHDCILRLQDLSEEALTAVLDELHALGRPVYHMLGNHCLYNLPRARLNER